MAKDNGATAALMLRALIAGASCDQIAADFGLTKSAVSQKTRMLAIDLQQIVGVLGVDEDASPTAALIRLNGDAYLEALEHFVPTASSMWHSVPANSAQWQLEQHLIKIARHSRCPQRDAALLLTLFCTAAKPLEIAQFEVRDYLDASGCVRMHSILRAVVAVNGRARTLRFSDHRLVTAIDAYLAQRCTAPQAIGTKQHFRGLPPASKLFLSRTGEPFALKRSGPDGQHLVCKEIHEIYRRIFAHGGHCGLNTAAARRIAALRLHGNGADPDEIAAALGVKKPAALKLLQASASPGSLPEPPQESSSLRTAPHRVEHKLSQAA